MHRRFVLVSVVAPVLALAVAIAGGLWVDARITAEPRSALNEALDLLPAGTLVAGFTDWSQIRERLDVAPGSTQTSRAALADDAALRDLSTRSVIGQLAEPMHDAYGWSVADLRWEAYGQSADGAAMVGRLDDSVPVAALRARLVELDYDEDTSGRASVWTLPPDRTTVSNDLTAVLGTIVLLSDERLVVAADRPAYAASVLETIVRDAPSLLTVRSAAEVASELVGADSALVQSGGFVCESTSLAGQDDDIRAQARAALDRSGDLTEPTFAGRGLDGGTARTQTMRFVFGFASAGEAAAQTAVRSALASGPFIGRSGRIEDSLRLLASATRGTTAVLRFRHDPDSTAYMTGDGPLLFAGCPLDTTADG